MTTREFVEQAMGKEGFVAFRIARALVKEGERARPIGKGGPLTGDLDHILGEIEAARADADGTDMKLELRASFKTAPTEVLPL